MFAAAGYSGWSLSYNDFRQFGQGAEDGGAERLAQYLAHVRGLDPSLPPPVCTNINLTGTALEAHVPTHSIISLPGGQRLALLSAFTGTNLRAVNPVLGSRVAFNMKRALQVEVARLHTLAGGLPEVVVVVVDAMHAVSDADILAYSSKTAAKEALGNTESKTRTLSNCSPPPIVEPQLVCSFPAHAERRTDCVPPGKGKPRNSVA